MSHLWSGAAAAFLMMGCQRAVPREQTLTFGFFCVRPAQWNELFGVMHEFGAKHGLELHGGIEKRSSGVRYLNVYLARGYSYWRGDDLDLWITSNPRVQGQTSLGGISKKRWTEPDLQMARDLFKALAPLQCTSPK